MGFETTFSKDVWHREAATLAIRNNIRTRRWGMRVTVYNDPTPANNGDWVLEYNQVNTNRQSNLNWLKVADIGQTWGGGGGGLTTADNGLTVNPAGNVQLGGQLLAGTQINTTGGYTFGIIGNGFFDVNLQSGANLGDITAGPGDVSMYAENASDNATVRVTPDEIILNTTGLTSGFSNGLYFETIEGAQILAGTSLSFDAGSTMTLVAGGSVDIHTANIDTSVFLGVNGSPGFATAGITVEDIAASGKINLTSTDLADIQTTIEFDPAGMLSMFSTADGFNAMSSLIMNGSGVWMGQSSNGSGNATLELNPLLTATLHVTDGVNISTITVEPTTIDINTASDLSITSTADTFFIVGGVFDITAGDVAIKAPGGNIEIQAPALNIDFTATTFTLNGAAPSSPSTEFFRADGTWAVPGGGGSVTADNGITLTGSNLQWGGALIQDTFIPSPTTPRTLTFGRSSGFANQPLQSIVAVTNQGITVYSGGAVLNSPNISLASNGVFVNSQYNASTNDTAQNIQERNIRTTGTVANGFGGREQVGVQITAGLGGAITHEYVALDVSGTGEFQWNICAGTVANPILNSAVVQSFIMRDRNVGFFTKDTSYGSGEAVMKIANATTPASSLVADSILMWAQDTSDSLSSLAFFTEQGEEVIGATVPTHKLKIQLNGTEYYLLLSTI